MKLAKEIERLAYLENLDEDSFWEINKEYAAGVLSQTREEDVRPETMAILVRYCGRSVLELQNAMQSGTSTASGDGPMAEMRQMINELVRENKELRAEVNSLKQEMQGRQ